MKIPWKKRQKTTISTSKINIHLYLQCLRQKIEKRVEMKIKRVHILALILGITIIIGVIIPFSLINNNSIILTRIYYKINYKGDTQNLETLIEKSELFEYDKYCKYRDSWGEGPINNSDCYYCYIDKDFIESLKWKIYNEKKKFHLYPGTQFNFIYSLEVTNESLIYLTYNNDNIIKAEYANHTEIFTVDRVWDYYYNRYTPNWAGNWYLNFTPIPFAPTSSPTIALNGTFLVKMTLDCHYSCGIACSGYVRMEQFLCFNSNIQTIFVYFPFSSHVVT